MPRICEQSGRFPVVPTPRAAGGTTLAEFALELGALLVVPVVVPVVLLVERGSGGRTVC
jgi:hypothetical protein